MSTRPATVFIVDDDADVRHALTRLLRVAGFEVGSFSSAREFLARQDAEGPSCLLLDVVMPEIDGFELQAVLQTAERPIPVIFLTASGNIPMTVRAMKAGAVTFLTKPFQAESLLAAVKEALQVDEATRRASELQRPLRHRLATLTPRERQVVARVVAGRRNKQIAADLGTAEKTVKVHRARAMKKLGARSVAELVQLAGRVGIGANAAGLV